MSSTATAGAWSCCLALCVGLATAPRPACAQGVPAPTCYVVASPRVECAGDDEGVWSLTLRIQNRSGFPIDRVFVWPAAGVEITPTAVSLEPVSSGTSTGEIEFVITAGARGDRVCALLSIHDSETDACCAGVEVCVVLPACRAEPEFIRGDSNDDGQVDISDGVHALAFLFRGGPAPACLDAADANDSGDADISDAIATFAYLFLGGPPPAPPGPLDCGVDPTEDRLGCDGSTRCG